MKKLPLLLLLSAGFLAATPVSAAVPDEPFAGLAVPEKRLAAQQALFDHARGFQNPSKESKAWFDAVRAARNDAKDPEVQAALAQVLLLDPEGPVKSPIGKAPVKFFPSPAGTTPETKLAETERLLDLKSDPKTIPLSTADLAALTKSEDAAVAQRACRLLRRVDAAAAAPLLWERLAQVKQRSQVQDVEDELLRLPSALAAATAPVAPVGTTPAQKAAWLRVVAVRKGVKVDPAVLLPLLKGPANELTEAAWDAVPSFFAPADRARLEEAAQGLSERLAPRAKAALERLR